MKILSCATRAIINALSFSLLIALFSFVSLEVTYATPAQSAGFRSVAYSFDTQTTDTQTTDTQTTSNQASERVVNRLDDVRSAVIRIETVGSFWYRSIGGPSRRGSGSGFIINEQGLAITNNHVVAGASNLQIWIDGEESPRAARILGVAECSDLAIIDIDGDGFPYLEWYQEAIAPQLAVHAAGYPYGVPNYTLTSGSISNPRATGDSSWSSISNVIEHSAAISPGDSGGPLVDGNGKVVAVNYLRSRRTGLSYAISRLEVAPIVELLSSGQSVDSIGISGESVALTDDAVAVWVSAVTPESPAAQLGLQPGDIIWNFDGSFLDPNSLMIDYCDTLKRNPNGQAIQIEIYRSATGQFLSGQINGQSLRVINPPTDQQLSISEESSSGPAPADGSEAADGAYSLAPPPTWTIVNEESRIVSSGIEVEIEMASSAGSNLLISAVGSEDVRFVRIDSVHESVRQSVLDRNLASSCPSKAESTITYGAYEMFYSRWTGCSNASEIYVMTAKSRTAPYHMVGLVGSFLSADDGYDVLLKTLNGMRVDNPSPRPITQQIVPRQAVPGQVIPGVSSRAIVRVDVLNVRSGPGLENAVVSQVFRGNGLAVLEQFNNCGWLQVVTPQGVNGWVSGNAAYVGLIGECRTIPTQ